MALWVFPSSHERDTVTPRANGDGQRRMKRARAEDACDGDARLGEFLAWCAMEKIRIADDYVRIESHCAEASCPKDGVDGEVRRHYCVRATRDIPSDTTIFVIPKTSLVCANNSVSGDGIREAELGGGLALNACALAERAASLQSAQAPFAGYFSILAKYGEQTLPMFWDETLRKELRGTELERHLAEDDEAFREDYETCIAPLLDEYPEIFPRELCDLAAFKAVASIAASRAFFVGGKYGECLVPCADLFNHRTGENSVAVFGVEDSSDDEDSDETFDENNDGDDNRELMIKTVKFIKAGDELFNTFGSQSNASLLHKYGFCETHNEEMVTVTIDVECFEEAYGKEFMHAIYDALKAKTSDADIEIFEDGKYFEIERNGAMDDEFLRFVAVVAAEANSLKLTTDDGDEHITSESILKRVLDARMAKYGDLSDLDEPVSEEQPPAGGGLVGLAAARLVRRQEVELLRRAQARLLG